MFKCLECGRKFGTANSAYRAAIHGCPKCGGVDIDIDVNAPGERTSGKHNVKSKSIAQEKEEPNDGQQTM